MRLNNGGIWIDYEFKKEYQDSSKKGLRVFYSKKLNKECIEDIKKFKLWFVFVLEVKTSIFLTFFKKAYKLQETVKLYPRTAVSPSFQKLRNEGHTDVKEDNDKN